ALARTGSADNADSLSFYYIEVHITERHFIIARKIECADIQTDITIRRIFYQIIMADIVFRVHNLFYPFIRFASALYKIEEHAERKKRPDHHAEIRRKRNQLSQRDFIRQNHLCTKDDREKVTRSDDEHDRRIEQGINLLHLQILFYNVIAQHLEIFLVTFFIA